jgi:tRNA(Ile)-lysidine synthase
LKENTFFFTKRNECILNKNFFLQAREIIFRSLSTVLQTIGDRYYSARGKKVETLIDNIKNNKLSKVTLGGCIIKKCQETVIITKEY